MILHPLRKLAEAGIREVLVVTGPEYMSEFASLLGSGADLGLSLFFRVQDRPGGIAEAIGLARSFAAGAKICVVLGDNLFEASLSPYLTRFLAQESGARVLWKEVEEPERFGVAVIAGGAIESIVEKPKARVSSLAVTGIYFFDSGVFEIIDGLERSQRGELEVSDLTSAYLEKKALAFDMLDGWWVDAGTLESLAAANALVTGGGR
jgi:glucose-1-phosphate thymidylyltransferase